jgi:hypothetical protein
MNMLIAQIKRYYIRAAAARAAAKEGEHIRARERIITNLGASAAGGMKGGLPASTTSSSEKQKAIFNKD